MCHFVEASVGFDVIRELHSSSDGMHQRVDVESDIGHLHHRPLGVWSMSYGVITDGSIE